MHEGIGAVDGRAAERDNAAVLVQVYDEKQALSLGEMERIVDAVAVEVAGYAYAWALANVEYIVQTDGMGDVERILNAIAAGSSTEAAIQEVLHLNYDEMEKETVEYLRKTYL